MTNKVKRIKVSEKHNILSGRYEKVEIGDFISQLQRLQNQGWEFVETDVHGDYDGGDIFEVDVTRMRPENDVEYNTRVEQQKYYENMRRQQYEDLKKEFGND
ncbi:hypothetical protein b3_0152 [Synechococcus phage B3]|nr:hypothetical protein b3_0152 [Synechococcus phage B3]QGT54766.1 hypothetical protein b23_0151 [Synechococcus phage B23]